MSPNQCGNANRNQLPLDSATVERFERYLLDVMSRARGAMTEQEFRAKWGAYERGE